MEQINTLTEDQLNSLPTGIFDLKNTRFMVNGCNINVDTGEVADRGCNVINHVVYWGMSRVEAQAIQAALRVNNPGLNITIIRGE